MKQEFFSKLLRDFISLVAIIGILIGFIGWVFNGYDTYRFLTEEIPATIETTQQLISQQKELIEENRDGIRDLDVSVRSLLNQKPNIIDYIGGGVIKRSYAQIRAGNTINIVYVLRRNASCSTDVTVQFFDHDNNVIRGSLNYTIRATQAPVSKEFSIFTVPVRLPDNMPDGNFSYAPIITPIDCGVYQAQKAPLSESFEVKND